MFQPVPRVTDTPLELQPHLAMSPAIDATERFLSRVFLRRYITWCGRRRRFAAMRHDDRFGVSAKRAVAEMFWCEAGGESAPSEEGFLDKF